MVKGSKSWERVNILGVEVDNLSFAEAVNQVEAMVKSGQKHLIVTPYSESIVIAGKDPRFRQVLNQADLSVADGISLRAAATYLALPNRGLVQAVLDGIAVGWLVLTNQNRLTGLKAQVRGVELMEALCQKAEEKKWRVFLLGGKGKVAQKTAETLAVRYPGLAVEAYSGSQNVVQETNREFKITVEKMSAFQPDLLFVAYGPIEQEKWLGKNLRRLPVKVAMGVGGAFDYLSGQIPRAPAWVRNRGLEWLYRLIREPKRLGRQLRLIKFVGMVFQARLSPT